MISFFLIGLATLATLALCSAQHWQQQLNSATLQQCAVSNTATLATATLCREQHWQQQGAKSQHPYAKYQRWLNQVEQAQQHPDTLSAQQLFDIGVAISSVLDVNDLAQEVLFRAIGVLNASKGMFISVSYTHLTLQTKA